MDYDSMTREQLMDLLWERRVKGWHFQMTKRGLINLLKRNDARIQAIHDDLESEAKS